jgi:hypothetical protein
MENQRIIKRLPKGVTHNVAAGYIGDVISIPEKLLTLSKSQLRHFSCRNFKLNGFYIGCIKERNENQQIDALQRLMEREEFKQRDSCLPVFNTMSSNDNRRKLMLKSNRFAHCKMDSGRNMIHVSCTKETELVNKATSVGDMIHDHIALDLGLTETITTRGNSGNAMVLTLLETEPAVKDELGNDVLVPDQLVHCDVDSNDKSLDSPDAYIGILATQMGYTELRVLHGSHTLTKTATLEMPHFIYRLQLPQYFYFVGHPFLLHSGCGSVLRNTRIHFYHGLSQESQSQTFFIKWQLSDLSTTMETLRRSRKGRLGAQKRKRALIGIA